MVKRPLLDAAANAVRSGSITALLDALSKYIDAESTAGSDPRDVMVGLAVFFDATQRLGADPATVFATAAERTTPELAELVRGFGTRKDVTLAAFSWEFDDTGSTWCYLPAD